MTTKIDIVTIVTAADLLDFLEDVRAQGEDLSTVYLLAADGEHIAAAGRREMTLTDGSVVTDVMLWTGNQARPLQASPERTN